MTDANQRILLLNGSPRQQRSGTLRITHALLDGYAHPGDRIDEINVEKLAMSGCQGCFSCWKTGKCILHDDMTKLFEETFIHADLVIWSFPLYFYSVPGKLKMLMDRLFYNDMPDIIVGEDGLPSHPMRFDLSRQKNMIVSSCGFNSAEKLYDPVRTQFRLGFGSRLGECIFCPQGGCLLLKQAEPLVLPYLDTVRTAGAEIRETGRIASATREKLLHTFLPAAEYDRFLNGNPDMKRRP